MSTTTMPRITASMASSGGIDVTKYLVSAVINGTLSPGEVVTAGDDVNVGGFRWLAQASDARGSGRGEGLPGCRGPSSSRVQQLNPLRVVLDAHTSVNSAKCCAVICTYLSGRSASPHRMGEGSSFLVPSPAAGTTRAPSLAIKRSIIAMKRQDGLVRHTPTWNNVDSGPRQAVRVFVRH
jgi:hypothetical protein